VEVKKSVVLAALFAWWLEIYTPRAEGPQALRKTLLGPYLSEAACQVERKEKAKIVGVAVGQCHDDSKLPVSPETKSFGRGVEGPRQDAEELKQGVK
jgi:hypothetical protein